MRRAALRAPFCLPYRFGTGGRAEPVRAMARSLKNGTQSLRLCAPFHQRRAGASLAWLARCIAGATLKVTIGDVLQSDKGMAGTYEHGQILGCGEHEALRHYKNGMLKCVPAVPVRDCTERTNLRRYGSADFFFTYRADVS